MTGRWPAKASEREPSIPPIGDLIRGAPAPGGTWPDHETSLGAYSLAATVCCMPRVEFRAPLTGQRRLMDRVSEMMILLLPLVIAVSAVAKVLSLLRVRRVILESLRKGNL